jgi:hypothetical protein
MINPTGNIILVNQQSPIVSNKVGDQINKFDLQAYAAVENAKQQDKRVREARPLEKNSKMDSQAEHEKETAREEQGYTEEIEGMLQHRNHNQPQNTEDEEIEYVEEDELSIIDIKV